MSDQIRTSTYGRVLTITLNRPEADNAFTREMYAKICDVLEEVDENHRIRCVIITGEGDKYTVGNDVQELAKHNPNAPMPGLRFLEILRELKTPVVAAVNGAATGIGLTMLLHCDLIFAAQSAIFSAPFPKFGLVPEAGSSMLLPLYVGNAWANDILLAAREVTADEALSIGLVSRVIPDEELAKLAEDVAENIASFAPNAMRKSKRLVRTNRSLVAVRMSHESKVFSEQLASREFKEALKAFNEKRTPVFS